MKKTKEIIIDAFWQLLEEKPFNKITVQNIVERCALYRKTVYYHFQDKKAFQHLYSSSQKDEFITYMNHVALHIVKMFMKQSSHYVSRSEDEKETLTHFYKCLMIGILIDWLECQGDYDLKLFVEKIYHLIDSSSQTLL